MELLGFHISKRYLGIGLLILLFLIVLPDLMFSSKSDRPYAFPLSEHGAKVMATVEQLPIEDSQLLECIRSATLDRARAPVTSPGAIKHVADLQFLDCKRHHITSLEGLDALTELSFLDISYNSIQDIAPLREMDIEILYLSGNPIDDIKHLRRLPKLHEVRLPNLPDLKCRDIKVALRGVKSNYLSTGCIPSKKARHIPFAQSPDRDHSQAKPRRKNRLTDSEEQELFEFENNHR